VSGTLVVAEHVRGRVRDVTRSSSPPPRLPRPVASPSSPPRGPLAEAVDVAGVDEVIAVTAAATSSRTTYTRCARSSHQGTEPDVVVAGFTVNSMGFAGRRRPRWFRLASDVFAFSVSDGQVVARRAFTAPRCTPRSSCHRACGRPAVAATYGRRPKAPGAHRGASSRGDAGFPRPSRQLVEGRRRRGHHGGRLPPVDRARDRDREKSSDSGPWPRRWARRCLSPGRSSTRAGCRRPARSASPARR